MSQTPTLAGACTRVVVFAHTPVMAEGLALLSGGEGVEIVGMTTDIDTLASLIVDKGATVVVTEVLTGSAELAALFAAIHGADDRSGTTATVVCVVPSPADFALDLRRRGAAAVVTMTDDPSLLRDAVTRAPAPRPKLVAVPDDPSDGSGLTARELDVLQAMVDGHSTRDIAVKLGVSVNTVRTHVQRLLPKLGAHNRLRAAAVAIERGLVSPSTDRLRHPRLAGERA